MKVDDLVARYPRLYHMAERGSWDSVRKHGLLSTSAIVTLLGLSPKERAQLERAHRPEKVRLDDPSVGAFVLRDQKPMNDARLKWCLTGGLKPADWYELLNGKVFFWVSHPRLVRLLGARAYRREEHDVLTVNAAPLIRKYAAQISLTHMNTGNTFPYPPKRGVDTFKSIAKYPTKRDGRTPFPEVVELVVESGVVDIRQYVLSVDVMRGPKVIRRIYHRT